MKWFTQTDHKNIAAVRWMKYPTNHKRSRKFSGRFDNIRGMNTLIFAWKK